MKCWWPDCQEPGVIADVETPPIFINPENPDDPRRYTPVHCEQHHREQQARRAENEASFQRMLRGR